MLEGTLVMYVTADRLSKLRLARPRSIRLPGRSPAGGQMDGLKKRVVYLRWF